MYGTMPTTSGAAGERPPGAPDRPVLDGLEEAWAERWEKQGVYHFDARAGREQVFAIDTPPPTVSGLLHIGHVFSYTHTDTVARYKRMRGYSVWYPMGWDDNGLPTERRVQNYFGVRCDPSLAYEPGFVPPAEGGLGKGQHPVAVSRPNFVELCERLTADDEQVFERTWRQLGLSVDWRQLYTTIGERSRRTSQRAFLRLLRRGEAYSAEAPTLWDVDFRTAVAQAELVDRERPGAYHALTFRRADGGDLLIDTTRPELLAACVAVVVHPEDERYRALVGSHVTTPLFGASVPVLAHALAQPDKGTGAAMVCTFGDLTDVTWWRELGLPVRAVMGRDGRMVATAPGGLSPAGVTVYETEMAGRTPSGAQRPVTHAVKFYERGERPLEIVTSRQWWIRTLAHKQAFIDLGRQLQWHPAFMRARYEDWVNGLTSDWLISRQRFFGIPFPLWYPLDAAGSPDYSRPLVADEAALPVDPTTDVPPGFSPDQREVPGGFTAEKDVMDTWATSSLSPQIAGGWEDAEAGDRWSRVFPMDLRPQAHDIIRTWLFSTIVRSHLEHGTLPWAHAAISGWILDPDRKKMSKSVGNVVTPQGLLAKHGSDAVRYWAASGRPGTDTAFVEGQIEVGRKLAVKVLNASKFVLSPRLWGAAREATSAGADGAAAGEAAGEAAALAARAAAEPLLVVEPVDRAFLGGLAGLVAAATNAFEDYDYARALEKTEAWFWDFCDNYLELVKARAYGEMGEEKAASARGALATSLSALLRLLAPFMPFVTEEVWSWWQPGSVHRAPWPEPLADLDLGAGEAAEAATYAVAVQVLAEVRRAKSEARVGPRAPVDLVRFAGPARDVTALRLVAADLQAAQAITELSAVQGPGGPATVEVRLAPRGAAPSAGSG
jgi:valyl-tRNA synthetase